MDRKAILELLDVHSHFPVRQGGPLSRRKGLVRAVDGVSLQLAPGEVLGLVGESGCGKSTLARTAVGLAPLTRGVVRYDGRDLAQMDAGARKFLRPRLQMIFQDPYASLNPRMTVFDALAEPMIAHRLVPRAELPAAVSALMEKVGLARRLVRKYPHEFSGGQRQRIAIARVLALKPKVILADEPVSALDVSVQAQIVNLIAALRKQEDLSLVFISHDLSVVRHIADRIAVMYLGKIVEVGPGEALFSAPKHPYTQALLQAAPIPDPRRELARLRIPIQGEPPSPLHPPVGCRFHPRCPYAAAACREGEPPIDALAGSHQAACIRADEIPPL